MNSLPTVKIYYDSSVQKPKTGHESNSVDLFFKEEAVWFLKDWIKSLDSSDNMPSSFSFKTSFGIWIDCPPSLSGAFLIPRSSSPITPPAYLWSTFETETPMDAPDSVENLSTLTPAGFRLANEVGFIDWDYRGEVKGQIVWQDFTGMRREDSDPNTILSALDRALHKPSFQLVFFEPVNIEVLPYTENTVLSSTKRGNGGFGSSDK